jgi:hypothetical protein
LQALGRFGSHHQEGGGNREEARGR